MIADFSLSQGIYLVKDGGQFDLHNDFDFESVAYSVGDRCVAMRWRRGSGAWVASDGPASIALTFSGVSVFIFTPREADKPLSDDDCVDELGYSSPAEALVSEYLVALAPDPSWLLTFRFASGATVSVGAAEVRARIGE